MDKRQMRALALRDPAAFRKLIHGARARELTARHLLLHPEQVGAAGPAALAALRECLQLPGSPLGFSERRNLPPAQPSLLRSAAVAVQEFTGKLKTEKL